MNKPPIDLTTAGASVDPQTLFNDPRYVPQPDMPSGLPTFAELVMRVDALEAQMRTTHREMVEYARGAQAENHRLALRIEKLEGNVEYNKRGYDCA